MTDNPLPTTFGPHGFEWVVIDGVVAEYEDGSIGYFPTWDNCSDQVQYPFRDDVDVHAFRVI